MFIPAREIRKGDLVIFDGVEVRVSGVARSIGTVAVVGRTVPGREDFAAYPTTEQPVDLTFRDGFYHKD